MHFMQKMYKNYLIPALADLIPARPSASQKQSDASGDLIHEKLKSIEVD